MKKTKRVMALTFLILLVLGSVIVIAEEANQNTADGGNSEVSEIDKILKDYTGTDVKELVPFFDLNTMKAAEGGGGFSVKTILSAVTSMFFKEIKDNMSIVAKIIAIAMLSALLSLLAEHLAGGTAKFANMACNAALIAFAVSGISVGIGIATSMINTLTSFLQAVLPVMVGLSTASGGIVSGTLVHPALIFTSQAASAIFNNVVIPLLTVSIAFSAADVLTEKKILSGLGALVRKICYWIIGILMTVFTGVASVRGIIGKSADQAVGKTVKYAVSNFIPVVGGFLSDAADTVMSSFNIIRNVTGVAVICGMIIICAVPVLKIGSASLLYRLTSVVVEPVTNGKFSGFLEEISSTLACIAGVCVAVSVMFIISLAGLINFM